MPEKIRLVIWDMDETFWKGTITEGGHEYIRAHHNIVIELARRGIISTICSKNDLAPVKEILEKEGLWSYFVFPSINWEPKGPRIASMIETIMLRPEAVMFIDDNPMNLNEALHFSPGLQVSDPNILPTLLTNPLFAGKDDRELTRLEQYKLLEKRHADEKAVISKGGSNYEFLRSSNVRVIIEFDVRKHIDRGVELVNRTNQLNFTKLRLSEDPAVARSELLALIEQYDIQAGLVRVKDNYGDYGFVGFYAIRTTGGRSNLVHYCFSCRTLGMGIETAVYRRIGSPWLPVVGEVLSDPRDSALPVDWITFTTGVQTEADVQRRPPKFGDIVMRGGCDFASVAHYFIVTSASVDSEGPIARNGVPIRRDHSLFLTQALDGLTTEIMAEFARLGYEPEDFKTRIFDQNLQDPIICLSFWTDSEIGMYRHRKLGLRIPFIAPYHFPIKPDGNVFDLPTDFHTQGFSPEHWIFGAIAHLRENYEYEGVIGEDAFKSALARILDALAPNARVFLLGANEKWFNPGNFLVYDYPHHTALNRWTRDVVRHFPKAVVLQIRQFIYSEAETQSVNHFERMVYFRIYEEISARSNSP
jgi:FkbH-like protein